MKKSIFKGISFLVFLALVIYGAFYLWQNRHKYFFKGGEIQTVDNQENASSNIDEEDEDADSEEGEDILTDDDEKDYFVPVIHQSDCEDECASRKSVDIEYKYCREICGFNDIKDLEDENGNDTANEERADDEDDTDGEDCDDIEDAFEEDVCWKTKAIKEKKDKYCDEIYSEELSKVCHNRVLEEIMK